MLELDESSQNGIRYKLMANLGGPQESIVNLSRRPQCDLGKHACRRMWKVITLTYFPLPRMFWVPWAAVIISVLFSEMDAGTMEGTKRTDNLSFGDPASSGSPLAGAKKRQSRYSRSGSGTKSKRVTSRWKLSMRRWNLSRRRGTILSKGKPWSSNNWEKQKQEIYVSIFMEVHNVAMLGPMWTWSWRKKGHRQRAAIS